MKSISFLFMVLILMGFLSKLLLPERNTVPEILAGPLEASVGISPLTNKPSGWYTSDVTIHILAPSNALANGKRMLGGLFTISEEGRHQVELQPGPTGWDNTVTQFVDIDKTAPRVAWITKPEAVLAESEALVANISDPVSGICSVEASLDNGLSWESQVFPPAGIGEPGSVHETVWSMHLDSSRFSKSIQEVTLRAHDCAGNLSPSEILAVRVAAGR